ncbi:MAG TPA: DUF5715 family protein, partial [Longimicrobiales bacterium]
AGSAGSAVSADASATSAAPAAAPVDMAALQERLTQHVDSIDHQLRRVPALSRTERAALRKDVNAVQIARAQALGVRVPGGTESSIASGRLVRLPDTTQYWIVRDLDYSVPYVTPATRSLLEEIGRRFQARLDSLGVPRYRLDITSVLRTPEKQAKLRRANRNASKIVSAHEFGTTLDIAYRRYAPPVDSSLIALPPEARLMADSMVVETARLRGAELQAVLGRVLQQLKSEGRVMIMMERQQTVYHITLAK